MRYDNNQRLREYLDRGAAGAYREHLRHPRFEFDDVAFAGALDQVRAQFPDLPGEDAEARAAFRLLTCGAAPEVAAPLPSRWYRCRRFAREKSLLSWPWLKLAWAAVVLLLLAVLVARSEPTPEQQQQALRVVANAMSGVSLLPAAGMPQGQPSGIIIQFQQGGSSLATRPAGLVTLNCSTGMSCSFNGTTFTLTSTGGGGGGSSAFNDITTGTNTAATMTVGSGGTLTFSGTGVVNADRINGVEFANMESLGKIPIGQGDGTAVWADPLVQGLTSHDVGGATTNPVAIGGYASAAAPSDVSADNDITRAWFLRNGSQVMNLASGGTLVTLGQKAMSASLPVVIASDQSAVPASQSGAWNITNISGTVSLPTGAATAANQATQTTSLQLIDNLPHANDSALSNGVPIQGQLDDTATGSVSENNVSTVRITSGRALHVAQQGNINIGTFPDNEPINVAQMNGVAVTMGNGASGTGVQRITIASDSTGQTRITDGTDVATVTAGGELSVNCGNCTGSGASAIDDTAFTAASDDVAPMGALYDTTPPSVTDGDVGIPRMTSSRVLMVDGSAVTQPVSGTVSIGTFPDNEPINLAQVAGATAGVNNGTAGNGVQRVAIASDNSAAPGIGGSATGSVVPSVARYIGGNGTGNLTGYLNCDNTAVYDASTNGSTQLVALTSTQVIYVCGFQISTSSSTAVSVNLRYGTGANCATSPQNITPSYPLQAASSTGPIGMVVMTPGFTGLKTAASNALCINTNAAVSVQALVWWTKF